MRLRRAFLAGIVLSVVACSSAQSGTISGSLPLNGLNVAENGSNLLTSTLVTTTDTITAGSGVGDYGPVPIITSFGPNSLDLTNLSSFTLSNANWGSFSTVSGLISTQTASFLNVALIGTFTPGSSLPGFSPTPTSLNITVVQSGSSLAEAIALSTSVVPEPASLTLFGIGIAGLSGYGLRRRKLAAAFSIANR